MHSAARVRGPVAQLKLMHAGSAVPGFCSRGASNLAISALVKRDFVTLGWQELGPTKVRAVRFEAQ